MKPIVQLHHTLAVEEEEQQEGVAKVHNKLGDVNKVAQQVCVSESPCVWCGI